MPDQMTQVPIGAHQQDAAWLITLWLAIHGGDPGPDEVVISDAEAREAATAIVAAVAPYTRAGLALPPVRQEMLNKLGLSPFQPGGKAGQEQAAACFITPVGARCTKGPPNYK